MRNGSEASGATIVRYGPHGCFAAAPHDMVPAQTNCAEMAIDNPQGTRYTGVATNVVVTVAQSAELWIVAPAVVGSSPIGHPRITEARSYAHIVRSCLLILLRYVPHSGIASFKTRSLTRCWSGLSDVARAGATP